MKSSKYLFSNCKYNNKDNIDNILIKSGLIKKICSGLYIWLPTGNKILNKLILTIKKEMNSIDSLEIYTPILQPFIFWKKNNNFKNYNSEILYTIDRKKKKFILSPTNEEIISNIIKNNIYSYNQLPIKIFQIQNKFRDEIRFRGITRTKEFLMKDSYSFHISEKCLQETYNLYKNTYTKILNKFKLEHFIIKTNSRFIKSKLSHEFHVTSKYGDESIIICKKTNKAEILKNSSNIYNIHKFKPKENLRLIYFKNKSFKYLINNNYIKKDKLIKVLICHANKKNFNYDYIGLVLKFNDSLCFNKIKNIKKIKYPIKILDNKEIFNIFRSTIELIGIFNINIPLIIDYNVALMSDFISSNNINKELILGINWNKDINLQEIADISKEKNKNKNLKIKKSLEVCHIFNLYDTYTKRINFFIKDKLNIKKNILMGCYGIGLSRIFFSIIEKNIDEYGIKLPYNLYPFEIAIIPLNFKKSNNVKNVSEKIYENLKNNNFDVLLDDRENKNFIYMLKDIELIGIPLIIIINEKDLNLNLVEIKYRYRNISIKIKLDNLFKYLYNIKKRYFIY